MKALWKTKKQVMHIFIEDVYNSLKAKDSL
jgi:hypothetical protein